ncbi:hypothetical protein GALL_172870 [mine drainage metagenome]|uniref:Uncharacterized protein n=1 Tax=mine drainage metagenome TaxID=410659 RepID=A0A1J5S8Q2_9ZZZZ
MELDELKNELNKKFAADENKSVTAIAALLKKRTFSVVRKLQRSLWFDLAANVFVLLIFIWQGLYNASWALRVYFSSFIVLSVVALLVLIYLIKKIQSLNNTILPVKQNLESIYTIVSEYKTRCFQLTMILIPVCIAFIFVLAYVENQSGHRFDDLINKLNDRAWIFYTAIIVYVLAITIGIYYFTKWWLKKLYGRFLDQLKSLIEELEENN